MKITKSHLGKIIKEEVTRLLMQETESFRLIVHYIDQGNVYDQTEWTFSVNGEEIGTTTTGPPRADDIAWNIVGEWGADPNHPLDEESPSFEGLVADVAHQLNTSDKFAAAVEEAEEDINRYARDASVDYGGEEDWEEDW